MRIIGIIRKFRLMACSSWFTVILAVLFLPLAAGCAQKPELNQAQQYAKESQDYFELAVSEYHALIKSGKDLSGLYYKLGKLYFDHGDFEKAFPAFKKSNDPEAAKYAAVSLYRTGDFTDALDIFSGISSPDDETKYFYGLSAQKLNLFDLALKNYREIKEQELSELASQQIDTIESRIVHKNIKELSPQTYKIIAGSPKEEEYPQAGAFILLADEKIEVTQDRKQVSQMHYLIKILNERGKENYSESHIDYDTTYEKVELEFARTIKPDGTVVDVGSRHIRDVSKYMNFPIYSNARVFIISFPEISEGAVIEYRVKISRNQLINKKDLCMAYPVQAEDPIIKASFTLKVPQDMPLHITIRNGQYNDFGVNFAPLINEEESTRQYSWNFKDVPQIIPESNMPPMAEINPTIFISSFNSWEEIYIWWWSLAQDKIKADEALNLKVAQLTKGLRSREDKIREIYNFCASKIRYVAVEYGQAGYEPHKAADTFKNKYGDCKDKAILLVTMLKEAGINDSWPVLISTKDYYNLNNDFASMLFNHAIAAVELGGRIIFMDTTAETCSFDDLPSADQNRRVLLIKDTGYIILPTPLYPANHNLLRQETRIKVEPEESIKAERGIFTRGVYEQAERYWLLYTKPQLVSDTLKEKIQEISIGAQLEGYSIKNLADMNRPVILEYSFFGPEYFISAGDLRISPQLSRLDTSAVARDKRKYPIDFGMLDKKETIFEIEIPDNFIIKYMPDSITEENKWFKLEVQYSGKGKKVLFKQNAELKSITVGAKEFAEFKVFLEKAAKKVKQRIIFEKKK